MKTWMLKGEFKPVTKRIGTQTFCIGFIHRRYDGSFEATTVNKNKDTKTDALETLIEAKKWIKINNFNRK